MFIAKKDELQNTLSPPSIGQYVVYGWKQSYFTRKLEAALIFYGIPFERKRIESNFQKEIRLRSGTHQIPILHTPENWMLADTTPIIMLLDSLFPQRRQFPSGVLGVLVHILEEYFDEWIARTSVHWRWAYEENHQLLAMDAADGDEDIAKDLIAWGPRVCKATGVSSEIQQREAELEYHRILEAAEAQLKKTEFLLGSRPSALDCIVLGGLRAHFNYDPVPRKTIHDLYPVTIDWCERRADTWSGGGSWEAFPASTDFAQFILNEIKSTYRPFALGNRDALKQKQKAFVANIYEEDVSYLCRPYIEQSRQMITHRINHLLSGDERHQVVSWLENENLIDVYL